MDFKNCSCKICRDIENINMKSKVMLALSSRTFWTLVVLFVINSIHANSGMIPTGIMDILNPILTFAGAYFHVNPSQSYTAPAV